MFRYFAKRVVLSVAIVTVAVGFTPILVLSVLTHSFWPRSKVTVPVSLVPSVFIGDSILLPLFNGVAALVLCRGNAKSLSKRTKIWLALLLIPSIAVSFGMNVYLHALWMKNGQTGFIALTQGKLSLAGKWHSVFASIQMAFVIWFLCLSAILVKDPHGRKEPDLLVPWRVFVVYAGLPIFDFAIWHLFIMHSYRVVLTDFFAIAPFPLALAVYMYLAKAQSKSQQDLPPPISGTQR